jgi:hypothetical protein
MDISFLRSSSISTFENYCQHKYYLIYNLGLEDYSNKKAELGTCVHAVLECLAGMKKNFQDKGIYEYNHPGFGLVKCGSKKFMLPYKLTDIEIDKINKSRKNKDIYKDQIKVEYGHIRYGVECVEDIFNKSFEYYGKKSNHEWEDLDYRNALNWTWMELDWGNGEFDPRKRKVMHPEYPFNIEIKKDWAKLDNGEYLRIKGTIDLVTEIDDGIIEIIDHKTGQRLNWSTGKVKEFEDLMEDTQLMLYYYAARLSFPEYHSIMLTIFFIRDGGPFTLAFDDMTIPEIENRIRENFEKIRDCKKPKLRDPSHKEFQCKTLCGFFKEKIENTCVCDYIAKEIDVYGIEKVSLKHRKKDFEVGFYKNPGE